MGQGLWMQTANEQYVDARLVVKGLREKVWVEDSGFKRFDVETVQRISPPAK